MAGFGSRVVRACVLTVRVAALSALSKVVQASEFQHCALTVWAAPQVDDRQGVDSNPGSAGGDAVTRCTALPPGHSLQSPGIARASRAKHLRLWRPTNAHVGACHLHGATSQARYGCVVLRSRLAISCRVGIAMHTCSSVCYNFGPRNCKDTTHGQPELVVIAHHPARYLC